MSDFYSRRSPVLSINGVTASSQSLASAVGIQILNSGGNAADAAVAMAAALGVIEPCSTGLGGDAFALYYDNKTNKISCLLGNGKTANNNNIYNYLNNNINELKSTSGFFITVPGAASLYETLINKFGNLTLLNNFLPAIKLCNGFSVGPITSEIWKKSYLQGNEAIRVFRNNNFNYNFNDINNLYPNSGDIIQNLDLSKTLLSLGTYGAKNGFYSNYIGNAIVDACKEFGGLLTIDDLINHETEIVEPIKIKYKDYYVYECPPPTHGLAVLLSLNYIQQLELLLNIELNNNYNIILKTHLEIECMRRAFVDALTYIGDNQNNMNNILKKLLSIEYAKERISDININYITKNILNNNNNNNKIITSDIDTCKSFKESDTVYFCVIDREGNGCSFINSNYMGFGTGIVPRNCGFALQNRGYNFSFDKNHINCIGPNKKPYHTIIPAMLTKIIKYNNNNNNNNNEKEKEIEETEKEVLFATLGVMGGFMQPQGHVQIIRHLIDNQLNPQEALDQPRWQIIQIDNSMNGLQIINTQSNFIIEKGYGEILPINNNNNNNNVTTEQLVEQLILMGHNIKIKYTTVDRISFGKGQIIIRNDNTNCIIGGSDPRSDGCAMPVV